jgi:hypothetical protein
MNGLHGLLLFLAAVAIFVGAQRAIDSTNPCSAFSQNGHCSSQFYFGE